MCWLVLALVLAPALGLMHQVVHASASSPAQGALAVAGHGAQVATGNHTVDTIHALFAGHSKADCVLLDQVALGHVFPAKALPLLQPLPGVAPAFYASLEPRSQHATPFSARAPPLFLLMV